MERKNGRGPGEAKAGPRRALLYIKYTTPRTERGRKASISGAEAGSNKAPDELGGRARMGEARARPQRRPGKALDEKHLEKVLYVDGSGALSTTTFSTAITAITATTATNPPACSANLYIYIQNVLCWEGPWAGKEAVWGPDDTKPYVQNGPGWAGTKDGRASRHEALYIKCIVLGGKQAGPADTKFDGQNMLWEIGKASRHQTPYNSQPTPNYMHNVCDPGTEQCRKASIRHPAHSGGQGPDVLHGRGRMAEAKGRPQRRPGPGWAGRVDADGGGQGRPAAAARA